MPAAMGREKYSESEKTMLEPIRIGTGSEESFPAGLRTKVPTPGRFPAVPSRTVRPGPSGRSDVSTRMSRPEHVPMGSFLPAKTNRSADSSTKFLSNEGFWNSEPFLPLDFTCKISSEKRFVKPKLKKKEKKTATSGPGHGFPQFSVSSKKQFAESGGIRDRKQ